MTLIAMATSSCGGDISVSVWKHEHPSEKKRQTPAFTVSMKEVLTVVVHVLLLMCAGAYIIERLPSQVSGWSESRFLSCSHKSAQTGFGTLFKPWMLKIYDPDHDMRIILEAK